MEHPNSGLSSDQGCPNSKQLKFPFFLFILCFPLASGNSVPLSPEFSDACSIYDMCSVREFFRTCSCDSDCYRYGTCCQDAPEVNKMANWSENFHCYSWLTPSPVFAKPVCADNWQGDQVIRDACESSTTNLTSDLMSHVLVSSSDTNTTYWNWNCALCNGESIPNLYFWTVQVSCPLSLMHMSITDARKNIFFDVSTQQWGIQQNERFLACPISFYQPTHLNGRLRFCAPNMTSDCPSGWKEDEVQKKCLAYHGERKMKTSQRYFRNVHCALCNGIHLEDLDCYGRNYRPVSSEAQTFKVVYNLNLQSGHAGCEVGSQRFDPFLKKCRSLRCALKDSVAEYDECISSNSGCEKRSLFLHCFVVVTSLLLFILKQF